MLERLKKLFLHSETIFLARVQVFVGLLLAALAQTDPSLFADLIGSKWFPFVVVGHGILVGYMRKRNDPELKERGSKLPY